jgi:hypothetical protein
MSDRAWLDRFIIEAAQDPGPLFRTIASARLQDLTAAAAALELVSNPAVRVLGYAALGRRSREQREEFLARAAQSAELLPEPESRVGVLIALIDALPRRVAQNSLVRLLRTIEDLSPDLKRRYRRLLESRFARDDSMPAIVPPNPLPDIRIDPDALAQRLALAHLRTSALGASGPMRIRPLGTAAGRSRDIRLAEIASSVGIDPHSFALSNSPMTTAAAALLESAEESSGASSEPAAAAMREMIRPERVVSTGFADGHGEPVQIVVQPGDLHFYFVEVGARVEGAAESGQSLPEDLEAASVIDVVMAINDDGLTIEGPRTGRLRIDGSGAVLVIERGAMVEADEALLRRRMFFAFRAPPEARHCSMRCSFYCRGILVQSRYISVPVGTGGPPTVMADYVRSRTLSPGYLAQFERPRLSIMLNRNANGTHTFRFYANAGKFEHSVTFGDLELKDHIGRARRGFRQAAWGTQDEWTEAAAYRFRIPRTLDSVKPDLLDLARRGRVLWDAVINKLADGPDAADALRELMRESGHVQFALKEAANAVLPIAILYDHELDTSRPDEQMQLCATFVRSLGGDLAAAPCFNGDCPNRDRDDVVCPGGFWGYRHAVGLPVSIGADQSSPPDVPPFVTSTAPSFTIGVSTDPTMSGRVAHLANLLLKTSAPQAVAELRDKAIDEMKMGFAPIVYFYCHGGLHEIDGPFIEVGPRDGPRIARNNLRKVRWKEIRPLVFINGCHTTRVSPEEALELVSAFVATSGASGVIGTEITVFESLASTFAEAFFVEFVTNKRNAGQAIRRARLRLLKDSLNPLGLVYIPFVDSSLQLCRPAMA